MKVHRIKPRQGKREVGLAMEYTRHVFGFAARGMPTPHYYRIDRSGSEYADALRVNPVEEVWKRLKHGKGQVVLMDIGCGLGRVLLEAKRLNRKRVKTIGVNLLMPPHKLVRGVDELHEGMFEEFGLASVPKADVIVSRTAATERTRQRFRSLKLILRALKPGGQAFFRMYLEVGQMARARALVQREGAALDIPLKPGTGIFLFHVRKPAK